MLKIVIKNMLQSCILYNKIVKNFDNFLTRPSFREVDTDRIKTQTQIKILNDIQTMLIHSTVL